MSNVGSVWTIERIDRLRVMWIAGASVATIASALGGGLTRNAVIGKAHRLELPTHVGKSVKKTAARPAVWTGRKRKPRAPQPAKVIPLAQKPVAAHGVSSLDVKLADLGGRQCHFITSGWGEHALYCGQETTKDGSWCAHHYAVVFECRAVADPIAKARKAA